MKHSICRSFASASRFIKQTKQTPNWAVIRVYNISKDTVNRAQDEFDKIDLRVGYGNETARLFYGLIRQYNYGLRADARDTFIDFVCSDGDIAFNQAYVSLTIAAGWTQKDQALLAVDSLIEYGVTRGYIGDLPTRPMPRGKALFGGTRYVLNNLMTNAGADWSIKNGQAEIRPQDELPPGVAIKLTPGTGLIGLPQQTVDGITLKALIDARFEYGSLIEVDNSTIQGANLPVEYTATPYTTIIRRQRRLPDILSQPHRRHARQRVVQRTVVRIGHRWQRAEERYLPERRSKGSAGIKYG